MSAWQAKVCAGILSTGLPCGLRIGQDGSMLRLGARIHSKSSSDGVELVPYVTSDEKYVVGPNNTDESEISVEEMVLEYLRMKSFGIRMQGGGQLNQRFPDGRNGGIYIKP